MYVILNLLLASTVTAAGVVEIGVLRDYSFTLLYLNGDCSWTVSTDLGGNDVDIQVAMGPQVMIEGTESNNRFTLKCVLSGGSVELLANVTVYDIAEIPPPTGLSIATDGKTLEWSHVFQPSDLPSDFVLIPSDLSYTVYVTERDNVDSVPQLLTADTNSLDISQVLDSCTDHEISVQALINGQFESPNSSSFNISDFSVPVFTSLSADLLVDSDTYSVQVIFELGAECLLSVFNITIGTIPSGQILLNVSRSDIEKGNVTFDLRLNISTVDVCSLVGVVSGGNDIGQSESVDIQLPPECDNVVPSSSVTTITVTPTMTPTTTTSDTPTPIPTPDKRVIIAVTVCLVIVIAVIAAVIILVLVYFRTKRKTTDTTDTVAASPTDNVNGDRTLDKKPPKPLTYTFVRPQKTGTTCQIPLVTKTTSEYAQIDHFKTEKLNQETQLTAPEEEESHGKLSKDPAIVGFSVENHLEPLLAVLEPVKRDWYVLGMHLNLSENFLDETETIIDTVEECLKEMIQNWLRYHEPTMESLNRALTEIKHSPVTFDTFRQEFVSTRQAS